MHCLMLASCYLQLFIRKHNQNQTTNYSWYTVPAILSTVSVLLIFFFGSCFEKGWISILPLCVCASFITCMQIAALLLVSWMEQTAHFREEALSLQTKSMAQKESIEALSTAYAKWLGIRFWWTVCRPQESFAKIFCCKWSVWRESVSRTAFIVCTLYCNFWCEAGKWKVSTAVSELHPIC